MSVRTRAVVVLVGVLVAMNAAVWTIERLVDGPRTEGPPSSSYVTDPHGTGAYADLFVANGRTVERLRSPLSRVSADPTMTLMVLDPGPPSVEDATAVRAQLTAGGRVVVGGFDAGLWADALAGESVRPTGGLVTARPLVPVAETAGVSEIRAPIRTAFQTGGSALPVMGDGQRVVLTVVNLPAGSLLLLSDASVLHNEHLADADNARFALNLAGPPHLRVAFAEGIHGYLDGQGVAAIPVRWRWMAAGLMLAAAVGMLARGRRLGPPDPGARDLGPARRGYVEAVASTLARTGNPADAIEPVRTAVRLRMSGRGGYDPMSADQPLREAALRLGLSTAEIDAVLGEGGSDDELVAAGRALARLHDRSGRPGG